MYFFVWFTFFFFFGRDFNFVSIFFEHNLMHRTANFDSEHAFLYLYRAVQKYTISKADSRGKDKKKKTVLKKKKKHSTIFVEHFVLKKLHLCQLKVSKWSSGIRTYSYSPLRICCSFSKCRTLQCSVVSVSEKPSTLQIIYKWRCPKAIRLMYCKLCIV